MGDIAYWLMDLSFNLFGVDINIADVGTSMESLLSFAQITSFNFGLSIHGSISDVEALISWIVAIVQVTATQLLVLFFMIRLIKMAMNPDRINWESIVMLVAQMFIYKFLIDHAYWFFAIIFREGDHLLSQISGLFGGMSPPGESPASTIKTAIDNADMGLTIPLVNWNLSPLVAFVLFLLCYLGMAGTWIGLFANIFLRVFRIIALMCYSPIPIATSAFDEGSGSKRFIMSCAAAAIEGLILEVLIQFYQIGYHSLLAFNSTSPEGLNCNFIGFMIGMMVLNQIISQGITAASQMANGWVGGAG